MFMDILKSLNWVDFLVLAILVRIIYIGVQTGVVTELFKLLGVFLTAFVCLHYYAPLAIFLKHITKLPWQNAAEPVSFALLWIALFVSCKFIRDGLFMLFTIEAQSTVDRWGGAILAVGRFFLVASMTLFLLLLPNIKYLQTKTVDSLSGKHVLLVAPKFYRVMCDGFVSKVFPSEKTSKAVAEQMKKVEPR
jgi:uncharacterized membrane protein required for colicin V production